MYEYAVVPVGDVRALRRRPHREVVEAGETTEEAVAAALTEFALQGWKLHSVVANGGILLIFERITRESAQKMMAALEGAP
jgi:hypothetical protein